MQGHMIYFYVHWVHTFSNEPIHLYYEYNDERREMRKVEIWDDGRIQFADANHECGSTMLSFELLPSLEEISTDPQFKVRTITEREFAEIWSEALKHGNQHKCI
jgi:hypothetical protein